MSLARRQILMDALTPSYIHILRHVSRIAIIFEVLAIMHWRDPLPTRIESSYDRAVDVGS
jgi:hypothetical protein